MALASSPEPRPIGELFGDLSSQLSTLVRQEAQLARTELTALGRGWMRDAVWMGVVAALGLAALLTACDALVLLLIRAGLAPWLASATVAVALVVTAGAIARWRADAARRRPAGPVETVSELKETAQWIKNETVGPSVPR